MLAYFSVSPFDWSAHRVLASETEVVNILTSDSILGSNGKWLPIFLLLMLICFHVHKSNISCLVGMYRLCPSLVAFAVRRYNIVVFVCNIVVFVCSLMCSTAISGRFFFFSFQVQRHRILFVSLSTYLLVFALFIMLFSCLHISLFGLWARCPF